MPRFRIEQRAPGDPMYGDVPWELRSVVDAPSADAALQQFFHVNAWYTAHVQGGRGVVHGVGHFRAMPEQVAAEHRFMVQRQDAVAGDERHRTWTDLAIVEAATADAALIAFVEHMRWEVLSSHANAAVIRGVGAVRAVPVDHADDVRVSRAPTGDAW
jgi:hypothetical protein